MKCFFISATMLLFASITHAQQNSVPSLITYQGKLVDASGAALPNGTYSLAFKLYDAATGGTLVWGKTYSAPVMDGVFSVALGATGGTAVPGAAVTDIRFAFGGPNRYLQIEVLSDEHDVERAEPLILLPRQQMGTVPYAVTALYGVPVGTVLMWWGDRSAIPPGFEICDGANPTTPGATLGSLKPDLRDRFVKGAQNASTLRSQLSSDGSHTISQRTSGSTALQVHHLPPHSHGYFDRHWLVDGNYGDNSFGRKIPAGSRSSNARGPDGRSFPRDTYWGVDATTENTGENLGHTHTIPQHDNRPAFQELFFIVRVK